MKKVAIIGSGLSGLSAALKLLNKNYNVTLFEKNGFSGGKVFSFNKNGYIINNSPHLILSGNKNIVEFLKKTSSYNYIKLQKRFKLLFYFEEIKKYWKCETIQFLPDYINILPSFIKYPQKKISDIFNVIKLLKDVLYYKKKQFESVYDYCCRIGLSDIFIDTYIRNMVESTLNTPLKEADISVFLNVLKLTFFGGEKNSLLIFFKDDYQNSIINNAVEELKQNNCNILYNTKVDDVIIKQNNIESISFNNTNASFDYYIFALQPYQLAMLNDDFKFLNQFNYSAIIAYHFIYEDELFNDELIGYFNKYVDWIFKHYKIDGSFYYSAVKSCADNILNLKEEDLKTKFIETLNNTLKETGNCIDENKIKLFTIFKDKRATVKNDINKRNILSKLDKKMTKNGFLIGNWTDYELPGTMEVSVKSSNIADSF